MKRIKVIACVLAASLLAGVFAGCSKTTKITTENFIKACEKLKLDEIDIGDDFDNDDIEDGVYAYADEDYIEDYPDDVETFLSDLRLDDVIDVDDITSFAMAVKCTGLDTIEDIREPDDIADVELDGAFAFQMQLSESGYAEDFMDYVDDMLDLANIDTKDLTNKEFFVSKNEGYFRFHIDVAKFAKIVLENDDIMDFVDEVSDADDFEDALNSLTGDVSVSVEINGTNIFVIVGGSVNSKPTVYDSFIKAFGVSNNPAKVPMNNDVVTDTLDELVDDYGRYVFGMTAMVGVTVAATAFQLRI